MARSIGNKLRDSAAEVCALMASSNRDEKGLIYDSAWNVCDTSTDRQARDLATETYNTILLHDQEQGLHLTARETWGEAESLLREGWSPGEALIDPKALSLEGALPEPGNPGLMPADQLPSVTVPVIADDIAVAPVLPVAEAPVTVLEAPTDVDVFPS